MRKKIMKSPVEIRNTDIRVRCTISHQLPLGDGRFEDYIVGRIYTLPNYDPAFFAPVIDKHTKNEMEVIDNAGE